MGNGIVGFVTARRLSFDKEKGQGESTYYVHKEVSAMRKLVITLGMLTALASLAAASDEPSFERGKELFSSTRLGTSGKSCASCHPGGSRLAQAAGYAEGKLTGIINTCITKPLKGTALDPASNEMKSLIIYVRTFAKRRSKTGSGWTCGHLLTSRDTGTGA